MGVASQLTSGDAPADCFVADFVAHNISEVPVAEELNGASSQSPRPDVNDAMGIKSHGNTEADNKEHVTVTGRAQDSANAVAAEVQNAEADCQNPRLNPELMIRELDTHPISNEQLKAEAKGIYAGLMMVEAKCIEVVAAQMPPATGQLDVTRYLLMIPDDKLILLQDRDMKPDDAVRTWFIKFQKDATEGEKKPSTLELTKDLSTIPDTPPTTSEKDSIHPHVLEKAAPQLGSPEDYLRGFQVALELHAKENEWPKYEELVAVNAAEISEEGRKKVIDGQHFLDIGYDLVDQLLRDFETVKPKAEKESAQAKEDPEATPTRVDETPKANGQAVSAREPQASPEEAGVAPEDSDKNTADTAVDAVALDEKTKFKSEKHKPREPVFVDMRPLNDPSLYKKVGKQYWALSKGRWIVSLNMEQYAAINDLHRTLLDEHHDFLLVSHHPSASAAVRSLPEKYNMLDRLWRYAIHSPLKVLRERRPESQEPMDRFIILAYVRVSLLEEAVPQSLYTWIEWKGNLARYGMAIRDDDVEVKKRWGDISQEEYSRVLDHDPTIGRIYHQLATLERDRSSSGVNFDATVSRLFYYTKSLVVRIPDLTARESLLNDVEPIIARNEEAAKTPPSVPQTDKDHFLTAISHLVLASLEPETDNRSDHLQGVYTALDKIGGPAKISRIRPSAQIGLLLCQLLLGIPLADKEWSPMMAAWAPYFVPPEDRTDSDAMANARDIHDATAELIRTMVPYLLDEADTRDLGVWGFIYVILVFMRALKTRPALLERLGSAFHAQVLAPFLNMLLREDEARGGSALVRKPQSELVTVCSLLNEKNKPGEYGFSTEDNIRAYHRKQEEQGKAERSTSTTTVGEATAEEDAAEAAATPEENTVTTEKTTTSDTTHVVDGDIDEDTKTPDWERSYANVLPEHRLLAGLFFAREAEPCDKSWEDDDEEPAAEQVQEESLTDSETDSEAQEEQQTEREAVEAPLAEVDRKESENKDAQQQDIQIKEEEKTQREDEQEVREAGEARPSEEKKKGREAKEGKEEVRRREGLLRDPPFFPNGWFKHSKHSFDEIQVQNDYVQSFESYKSRSNQILRLAAQLVGPFFTVETDDVGCLWISVPGASSAPKPDPNKKMPEIIERDGGVRVVYVHPSSHAVDHEAEAETTPPMEDVDDSPRASDADQDVAAATASADSASDPQAMFQLGLSNLPGMENATEAILSWRELTGVDDGWISVRTVGDDGDYGVRVIGDDGEDSDDIPTDVRDDDMNSMTRMNSLN